MTNRTDEQVSGFKRWRSGLSVPRGLGLMAFSGLPYVRIL